WWCKSCFRDYFVERGQLHRDQVASARKLRCARTARIAADSLEAGCRDCGERDRSVLEFDHIGAKRGNVSDMVRSGIAPRRGQEQITACEGGWRSWHRPW